MRQVGLRVADALHDGKVLRLPQRRQGLEGRVQARAFVELDHVVALDCDPRPQRVVSVVGVWDHGVQRIVAAFEFHEDQQAPVAVAAPVALDLRKRRTRQPGRRHTRGADRKEVPAFHHRPI